MKIVYTAKFQKDYVASPADVRKAFDKQLRFLSQNLQHPSLHAKKYDESTGLWQARVNRSWRFYFTIEGDSYVLHTIIAHPK
jgi:mRNA-degrading endonuclease RelE of RelBE toxin-antitoxin system